MRPSQDKTPQASPYKPIGPDDPNGKKPTMSPRAILALSAWVILADYLIYRAHGYSGPAVFFATAPTFFWLHRRRKASDQDHSAALIWAQTVCVVLAILAAMRLMFVGNVIVFLCGVLVLFAIALTSSGTFPWALEVAAVSFRGPIDGAGWLRAHRPPRFKAGAVGRGPGSVVAWVFPALATLVFAGIFVFANPDLLNSVSRRLGLVFEGAWEWLTGTDFLEIPFCVLALLFGAGLFFPRLSRNRIGGEDSTDASSRDRAVTYRSPLYHAYFNTLICVIGLFAVYLVFEFYTLWMREFPEGFYYAGYAHQGAAWLTVALALATGLLSIIFHGKTLADFRVARLRRLAWIWSVANLLLAIAVYHRLAIYVGFNGLTPMRIVGYFGTTSVLIGFGLVVAKIAWEKRFWWLIRTQLTALALCLIALVLLPIDYVAHHHNANQIRQGYLPPSVMIAVKSKDDSGYLPLLALVDVDDVLIRDGVRAMLAQRKIEMDRERVRSPWHWTRFQAATHQLATGIDAIGDRLTPYLDDERLREETIGRFRSDAMQWY